MASIAVPRPDSIAYEQFQEFVRVSATVTYGVEFHVFSSRPIAFRVFQKLTVLPRTRFLARDTLKNPRPQPEAL
jgi:hypothetical protein